MEKYKKSTKENNANVQNQLHQHEQEEYTCYNDLNYTPQQWFIKKFFNTSAFKEINIQLEKEGMNYWKLIKYLISPHTQRRFTDIPKDDELADAIPKNTLKYFRIAYHLLPNINVFNEEKTSLLRFMIYITLDKNSYDKNYASYQDKRMLMSYMKKIQQYNLELIDLNVSQSDKMPYDAYFCVLYDHNIKEIIIVCRGTVTLGDLLTDFDAISYNQKYHRGFYYAAVQNFQYFKQQKYFSDANYIKFVGYSMGASVATILQILAVKNGMHNTSCYCFSPAPCINNYINRRYLTKNCFSFIIENDIVPQMSITNARVLITRMKAFYRYYKQKNKSIEETQLLECDYTEKSQYFFEQVQRNDDLVLGGQVYRLYKGDFYKVDNDHFKEMDLIPFSIYNHIGATHFENSIYRQQLGQITGISLDSSTQNDISPTSSIISKCQPIMSSSLNKSPTGINNSFQFVSTIEVSESQNLLSGKKVIMA